MQAKTSLKRSSPSAYTRYKGLVGGTYRGKEKRNFAVAGQNKPGPSGIPAKFMPNAPVFCFFGGAGQGFSGLDIGLRIRFSAGV